MVGTPADAPGELKSDFLKEITTMKKITMGNCPYVVNMVGCCTTQEPLALVLEYLSQGDLLEYLRKHRKQVRKRGGDCRNHMTREPLRCSHMHSKSSVVIHWHLIICASLVGHHKVLPASPSIPPACTSCIEAGSRG